MKRKVLVVVLLGFCFSTFLLMEAQYRRIGASSMFPLKPKIAFLFLAEGNIPHVGLYRTPNIYQWVDMGSMGRRELMKHWLTLG
ncbi:hypothetical protein HanIR_Chr16g0828781 [Helianthus annuus]|nr:hypothetical protein HanIR_Chr16g0828781 [Helianthus annuus]